MISITIPLDTLNARDATTIQERINAALAQQREGQALFREALADMVRLTGVSLPASPLIPEETLAPSATKPPGKDYKDPDGRKAALRVFLLDLLSALERPITTYELAQLCTQKGQPTSALKLSTTLNQMRKQKLVTGAFLTQRTHGTSWEITALGRKQAQRAAAGVPVRPAHKSQARRGAQAKIKTKTKTGAGRVYLTPQGTQRKVLQALANSDPIALTGKQLVDMTGCTYKSVQNSLIRGRNLGRISADAVPGSPVNALQYRITARGRDVLTQLNRAATDADAQVV